MAQDVQQLRDDFDDLKVALQEYGVIANNVKKTGGLLEKQIGKMQSAFNKNPVVQLGKGIAGFGKQMKMAIALSTRRAEIDDDVIEQMEKKQTMMGKLTTTLISYTAIGKLLSKNTKQQVGLFRRLTMSLFGLISIFLLVGFAIAALSVAFQGAESPLLDFTDGIPVLDEGLQGLIMAMTGEGEGGLLGALNVVTAALIVALPVWILFGAKAALITSALILVAGAYELVKQGTGSVTAALAAAAAVLAILVGGFLYLKGTLVVVGTQAAMAKAAMKQFVGGILLGVGLIIAGAVGLYAFITGKVSGLLGWIIAAVSAFAIAIGLFMVGIITAPFILITAIGILIVAVVLKYRDEILYGLEWFFTKVWDLIMWVWDSAIKPVGELLFKLGGLIGSLFMMGVAMIITVVGTLAATVIGIIMFPFIVIKDFVAGMWKSFLDAKDKGWRGILVWVLRLPKILASKLGGALVSAFKTVFNGVASIYNGFAGFFKFDIPDWVPLLGGKTFQLPQIPMLAKGGIVNKPTLAMVGEDGPEAVVPLSKKNNPQGIGLGGNMTININVGGVTDRTDKRALAREIGDAIRDEMYRSGRSMGTRRGAL